MHLYTRPDGSSFTVFSDDVIGLGQSGIVLRRGEHALKIPKARDVSNMAEERQDEQQYLSEIAREVLDNEIKVYQRIGKHSGVAECVELSRDGIWLIFYEGGNLDSYIGQNEEPEWCDKRQWILSAIETVAHLHDLRILIDDLALRNFVIAGDSSLKMIDFGQCALLPFDIDLSTVNVHGLTAKYDIFHLGCIIYSLAAWRQFEYEAFDLDSHFPPLDELPATDHLPCAEIIKACWTGAYANMNELEVEARRKL